MNNILYVVVPCYNEEEVLHETAKRLNAKFDEMIEAGQISEKSKIAFVNDGSKDKTWEIIEALHMTNPKFVGINLSRNKGHQNALLAGLMTVKEKADMVVSMDADLQDDINAMVEMVRKYNEEGCEIVYGVRSARDTDTKFKKMTAEGFYKLMNLMGVELVFNHADYRLMSKRALNELENFKEVNLFLRGIVPLIGFKTDKVYYERSERFAGESKYPLKKMLNFAMDGITSFSIKPIRMITTLGFVMLIVAFIALIYSLIARISGHVVPGWTSLIFSIWIIGALQMVSIGVVGEYIGKIYLETKARPKFIISDILERDE